MKYALIILASILFSYFIWTQTSRAIPPKELGVITQVQQIGQNAGKGNLLGIQPWMDDIPVFDTPVGKLGVLVCADSWYPEAYKTSLTCLWL